MTRLHSLSPEELLDYERDGFATRESVFSRVELAELRQATDDAISSAIQLSRSGRTYILDGKRFVDEGFLTVQFEHSAGSKIVRVIEPVYQLHPLLEALVDDPRLVDPMIDLVGQEKIALWTAKLNLKSAREGSGFGWHQDSPYWVHDCNHVDLLPNVMLAFDEATEANGCFRAIRGSHTKGCLPGTDNGTQLGGFYTDPGCFDESEQVPFVVPAGSLIFFNPHVVHGSLANHSDQPRRAMVLTYQPAGFPALKSGEVRNVADSVSS
jgi:hypothetical protein